MTSSTCSSSNDGRPTTATTINNIESLPPYLNLSFPSSGKQQHSTNSNPAEPSRNNAAMMNYATISSNVPPSASSVSTNTSLPSPPTSILSVSPRAPASPSSPPPSPPFKSKALPDRDFEKLSTDLDKLNISQLTVPPSLLETSLEVTQVQENLTPRNSNLNISSVDEGDVQVPETSNAPNEKNNKKGKQEQEEQEEDIRDIMLMYLEETEISDVSLTPSKAKQKRKEKRRKKKKSVTSTARPVRVLNPTISFDASIDVQFHNHNSNHHNTNISKSNRARQSFHRILGHDEYETILKRRIQFTNTTIATTNSTTTSITIDNDQDLSLGMHLTILSGRVVVQSLNPLNDGRASPAQMSGKIKRGDILVQINDTSLRTLTGISLLEALNILSATGGNATKSTTSTVATSSTSTSTNFSTTRSNGQNSKQDNYDWEYLSQELRLRFIIGEGLKLLQNDDDETNNASSGKNFITRSASNVNALFQKYNPLENDFMNALNQFIPKDFQLVDQLTGMPFNFTDDFDDVFSDHLNRQQRSINEIMNKQRTIEMDASSQNDDESRYSYSKVQTHISTINASTAHNELLAPINYIEVSAAPTAITNPLSLMSPTPRTLKIIAEDLALKKSSEKWLSAFFQLDASRSLMYRIPLLQQVPAERGAGSEHIVARFETMKDILMFGSKVMKGAGIKLDTLKEREEKLLYGDISHNMSKSFRRTKSVNTITILENSVCENNSDSDIDGLGYLSEDDDLTIESRLNTDAWKQRIIFQLQQATDYANYQKKIKKTPKAPHTAITSEETKSPNINIKFISDAHATHDDNAPSVKLDGEEESIALESFLFGGTEQSKALTSQSKSLPPLQITTSLYDLAMSLERSMGGMTILTSSTRRSNMESSEISMGSFGRSARAGSKGITILMSKNRFTADKVYFLLQDALPLWFSTFSPLRTDMRRLLWPRYQSIHNGGFPDQGDDVSVISMGGVSSFSVGTGTYGGKPKQWRDILEENKLNPASRTQTCRLITIYFTQKILLQHRMEQEVIIDFITSYGAYLDLNPCLISAGNLRLESVIHKLLEIAKYDLHHKDAMGILSKKGTLALYKQNVTLSALLESVKTKKLDGDATLLLVSAYPDLKPWQISKYFAGPSRSDKSNLFYYNYLSSLLHPTDGIDNARQNKELVSEWCELSATKKFATDDKANFYSVVENKNMSVYYRDLPILLKLSMKILDFELALDLVSEIISHPSYGESSVVISSVLHYLRVLGETIIQQKVDETKKDQLRRMVENFHRLSTSKSDLICKLIHVPDQFFHLLHFCLNDCEEVLEAEKDQAMTQNEFIEFIAEYGNPNDVLETLKRWTAKEKTFSSAFHLRILEMLLKRAAHDSYHNKLTGAMIRIQKARDEQRKSLLGSTINTFLPKSTYISNQKKSNDSLKSVDANSVEKEDDSVKRVSIWGKLLDGDCFIDK